MEPCLTSEQIEAFVADAMPPEQRVKAEAHLQDCERCRAAVEARRSETQLAGEIQQAYQAPTMTRPQSPAGGIAAEPPPIADTIEGYEILREIHRGGQGVVYKAVQKATKRTVALKMLLQGPYASAKQRHRFEREIDLVASLQHPNIVTIYDSGVTQGRHYFAMEYIHGQSLDTHLSNNNLSIDETLRLFQKICSAVNYAHQRGVIHRDLKPGNIRIDAQGEPHVLDFGLAKAAGSDLSSGIPVTMTGEFMGTLAYASPEQTKGDPGLIDIRTDVYSLGVILYEMLTGKYPYLVVGQMAEVLRNIAEAEPNKPSTIRRQINNEVETIVLKALSKERERRYQSAENLAQDIEHYLAGDPIDAKRDSGLYVLKKQLKRYWLPAAVGAAFILLLAGSTVALSIMYQNQSRARKEAVQARTDAIAERDKAETARRAESQQRDIAEVKTTEAVSAREKAEEHAENLRRSFYTHTIMRVQNAYKDNDISRMKELLAECPADLRGWEWHRLMYVSDSSTLTLRGHESFLHSVAFSPDGTRIVSGSRDKTVKVWDAATGENTLTLRGHGSGVESVAFSPDGTRIISGSADKTVKVWNTATGENTLTLRGHEDEVDSVAFSPDGTRIVSGGWDWTVKVWDAATGQNTLTLRGHEDNVYSVAFIPGGTRIISGSADKTVKVWDAATGENTLTLRGHEGSASSVAFSPDGTRIVSGSYDKTVKIWDAATGENTLTLRGHERAVYSVAFSPDGTRVVSGSMDNTIKVWNAATRENMRTLHGHEGSVSSVAFSPDGMRIVSGSADNTVRVWDATTGEDVFTLRVHAVRSVAFSPDGTRIVSGGWDRDRDSTVKVWDAATGENTLTLRGHEGLVWPVAFSLDGTRIRVVFSPVAFSPDGTRIVSGSWNRTVKVWDAATGENTMTLRGHEATVYSVAFSPDGTRIVSGGGKTINVWDSATGENTLTLRGHEGGVGPVAFSPDGTRIVSGGAKTIKVWDAGTGENTLTLRGHESGAPSVAFSPDGTRIVSGSWDKTVKVWDAATGENILTLRGHEDNVYSVAFSPGGTRIISGSADKTVKVWDAATGENTLTLRRHEGAVSSVAFSPDGTRIVSGSWDKTVKVWETTTPSRAVLLARQTVVARQRHMQALEKRFSDLRRGGLDSMEIGQVAQAYEQFQKAHDIAARLTEAEPENERYQLVLARLYRTLSRVATRQGNVDEIRQWALKLIQTQRRLIGLPRAGAFILNEYAWELLTCEPADLRDPVAALPVAKKAVEKSGGKDAGILGTLALAYFLTGDAAKAIETEEKAISLLPPGDSPLRTSLEKSRARFRLAATSQPTTTQPVE